MLYIYIYIINMLYIHYTYIYIYIYIYINIYVCLTFCQSIENYIGFSRNKNAKSKTFSTNGQVKVDVYESSF